MKASGSTNLDPGITTSSSVGVDNSDSSQVRMLGAVEITVKSFLVVGGAKSKKGREIVEAQGGPCRLVWDMGKMWGPGGQKKMDQWDGGDDDDPMEPRKKLVMTILKHLRKKVITIPKHPRKKMGTGEM